MRAPGWSRRSAPGVTSVTPGDHVVLALYGPCLACRNCLSGNPVHCNGPARIKAITGEMADGSTRLSLERRAGLPLRRQRDACRGGGAAREPARDRGPRRPARRHLPRRLRGHHRTRRRLQHRRRCGPARRSPSWAAAASGSAWCRAPASAGAAQIIAVDTNPLKLGTGPPHGRHRRACCSTRVTVVEAVQAVVPGRCRRRVRSGRQRRSGGGRAGVHPTGRALRDGRLAAGRARTIPVDGRVLFSERRLLGCTGGSNIPARDIPRIERLYRSGALELEALVSQRFSFADAPAAFAAAQAGQVARAVVVIDPALAQKGAASHEPADYGVQQPHRAVRRCRRSPAARST